MVDPLDFVDLTMTCDSGGEASLSSDGETVVNIPSPPVDEKLRRTPAKKLPSLAQRFTEIYSRECSNLEERSCSQEGVSSKPLIIGPQSSKRSGDPKSNLGVDCTLNIMKTSFNNDLPGAKIMTFTLACDTPEKTGLQCVDEVIEVDGDSNDQTTNDVPACIVVPSDDENCHGAMRTDDFAIMEHDHWGEVDIKYHNGEPPGFHTKSPDSNLPSPVMSPNPHTTSEVPSLKPGLVNEQLVDTPMFDEVVGITVSRRVLAVDKLAETENERSIISINSENESDDSFLVQSPTFAMYYCMYCEYSTTVEESCRRHISGHLPGAKPYLRMYCTECSLSTGSEKALLFHMYKTHHIKNPEMYKSGKERYTCGICKVTQKLRTDIESHIYNRHKSWNRIALMSNDVMGKKTRRLRFQCVEKGCARTYKTTAYLHDHVTDQHRIVPLYYYEFVPGKGKPSKHANFRCFTCGFKDSDERRVRIHAWVHYANVQVQNIEGGTKTAVVSQSEEMARAEHNREFQLAARVPSPGSLVTSPRSHEKLKKPNGDSSDPDFLSPALPVSAAPEPNLITPAPRPTSPEPDFVDGESLMDTPEYDDENPSQMYDSCSDEEGKNDNGSTDSDCQSENCQGQPRTFYCIYCEYTTVIEEWYHKHIASHVPGTKPYFRMYCTECSYSTGSEKYLLFHMSQSHRIVNPEFYRSGEKRYTCRICRHTLELRIDIESHILAKHKSEKQTVARNKKNLSVTFQCNEEECGKSYKSLKWLRSHVQKHHNIRYPSYYYERSQATGELKLKCFSCGKIIENKGKSHAKVHYSSKQRRAPYLYYCPAPLEDSTCPFSSKKRSEITEHYQSEHFKNLKYYRKPESSYACLSCPYIVSGRSQMENHCTEYCKNR